MENNSKILKTLMLVSLAAATFNSYADDENAHITFTNNTNESLIILNTGENSDNCTDGSANNFYNQVIPAMGSINLTMEINMGNSCATTDIDRPYNQIYIHMLIASKLDMKPVSAITVRSDHYEGAAARGIELENDINYPNFFAETAKNDDDLTGTFTIVDRSNANCPVTYTNNTGDPMRVWFYSNQSLTDPSNQKCVQQVSDDPDLALYTCDVGSHSLLNAKINTPSNEIYGHYYVQNMRTKDMWRNENGATLSFKVENNSPCPNVDIWDNNLHLHNGSLFMNSASK